MSHYSTYMGSAAPSMSKYVSLRSLVFLDGGGCSSDMVLLGWMIFGTLVVPPRIETIVSVCAFLMMRDVPNDAGLAAASQRSRLWLWTRRRRDERRIPPQETDFMKVRRIFYEYNRF